MSKQGEVFFAKSKGLVLWRDVVGRVLLGGVTFISSEVKVKMMREFEIKGQVFQIEKTFHDSLYFIFLERREIARIRACSYVAAIQKFIERMFG